MENLLGMSAGVSQRVNGTSPSASIIPFRFWTHCANGMLSECMAFRPSSRSCSFNSTNSEGLSCRLASNSPLSSKHSRIAARRYASLSSCLRMSSRGGRYPSCGDRCPPGKTWAEAKELEVWTRWRRSIRFEGDIRRILEPSQSFNWAMMRHYFKLGKDGVMYLALGLATGIFLGEAWASVVDDDLRGRSVIVFLKASSSLSERDIRGNGRENVVKGRASFRHTLPRGKARWRGLLYCWR